MLPDGTDFPAFHTSRGIYSVEYHLEELILRMCLKYPGQSTVHLRPMERRKDRCNPPYRRRTPGCNHAPAARDGDRSCATNPDRLANMTHGCLEPSPRER